MTVSTTLNKINYVGDGVTLTFTFPFAVPAASPQSTIQAFVTTSAGVITQLTLGTQYAVTYNAAIIPNPTPVGGLITLTSPVAVGSTLTILRALTETQQTSLANQGALYQPVIEGAVDNNTMLIQQLQELLGRQIAVAISDPVPTALPPAAQRALLFQAFDSLGNPIAAAPGGANTPVSSAMAPVVAASTIAGALALLGLTGVAPLPTGMLAPFAGAAPTGWILAAGQAVPRTGATAALFAYCGTQFGIGDGSTTFNLPDLRGRVPAGIDNMNGITAGRLTSTTISAGGGPTVMGGNGGAETIVLTQGQLPAVAPTFTGAPTAGQSWFGSALTTVQLGGSAGAPRSDNFATITPAGTISNLGLGNPTQQVQPTIVMNWCIKT